MVGKYAGGGALVLLLLCVANALNIADRVLLGVVQEAIKHDFALSDFQLGLLGGPAFAILYSILGLPIAWLAERANRSAIVAAALALFSVMTAACGAAQNFIHLLLARMGVSVGEAGVSPPALALISDHYPPERRAMAMSTYAVGGPVGALLATIGAGILAQAYGWRSAFLLFGLVGLLFAGAIALIVRDAPRRSAGKRAMPFMQAIRQLARRRTIWHICIGGALTGASAMFIIQYLTSFFIRVHGLTLAQASLTIGAMSVCGIVGTFAGGVAADRANARRPGSSPVVISLAYLIAAPAYVLCFWSSGLWGAVGMLMIAATVLNCYTGISYAGISSVAPAAMRATALAFFPLANNLVGYALGPPLFGKLSDIVAAATMRSSGLDPTFCAANPAIAGCVTASGTGLRWALSLSCALLLGAAFSFWRASRWMRQELEET